MRWVVGDVHGCARELDALLREIRFDPARDTLFSIGDLVNTGPDSAAVLRMWRDLGARGVIGNHDVYAVLSDSGRWPRKPDQLHALRADPEKEQLLGLLRRLPLLLHLPSEAGSQEAWLIHAGVHPRWNALTEVARRTAGPPCDDDRLESEDLHFGTRVRCCTPEGERVRFTGLPGGCPPGTRPWDAYYRGETLIVHGHWGKRGAYREDRVIGLDSGCVYGGRLTAWCAEEDRTVSVASSVTISPAPWRIEAVVFDLDGVLVDSYAAHFESWKLLGEETGVTLTETQFAESFGRRSREVIRQHWGDLPDAEIARLDRRKEGLFREILERDFPGMDGAKELIEALAAAGLKIGVGSSAPKENVALVLERLGVRDRIQAVVTGEDVTRGKPDPQVFLLAADRLDISPRRCVVIEDAVPGIEAAKAAGMKSVALVSTGRDEATLQAARPDLLAHSLKELSPDRLRRL